MKRVILCADGTWNRPNERQGGKPCPTNVVRIAQAIKPTDWNGTSQVIYYHDGVGTHPGIDRVLGGMFGLGLDRNICDLYRFLVQNLQPGDEVFLFGFSRGAFTVRSLAGMIRKCGILHKEKLDQVEDAFRYYRNGVHPADDAAVAWRAARSWETRIKCVGVFDTVGALGIPDGPLHFLSRRRYAFHDVQLSTFIDNAFHALATDEQRAPFRPTIWDAQAPAPHFPQRVEQVWFLGVHSDVGGGYADSQLSDIALGWMMNRAASCGLEFLWSPPTGDLCGALHDSMTWYYRVLGDGARRIGDPTPTPVTYPATCERLDQSVTERFNDGCPKTQPYQPKNLADYLRRNNQPMSAPPRASVTPIHD